MRWIFDLINIYWNRVGIWHNEFNQVTRSEGLQRMVTDDPRESIIKSHTLVSMPFSVKGNPLEKVCLSVFFLKVMASSYLNVKRDWTFTIHGQYQFYYWECVRMLDRIWDCLRSDVMYDGLKSTFSPKRKYMSQVFSVSHSQSKVRVSVCDKYGGCCAYPLHCIWLPSVLLWALSTWRGKSVYFLLRAGHCNLFIWDFATCSP